MTTIAVTFACGHAGSVGTTVESAPICHCGETRIVRTFSRPPRFSGACSGPYCETKSVEAGTVSVASAGTLRMKEQE